MKKFFICFVLTLIAGIYNITSAQVEPAKVFDNTAVTLKGGVVVPMNDHGTLAAYNTGIEVEKWLTPSFGLSLDGNFMLGVDDYNTHTVFDFVNLNGLFKFNVLNMFTKYTGTHRVFEPLVFTGLGWGHWTAAKSNNLTYKAGVDFDLNVSDTWTVRLEPAVVWGVGEPFKLNKNRGIIEYNVSAVYRFGQRDFTLVRRYNKEEVDNLNGLINKLREDNAQVVRENEVLKAQLYSTSQVVDTVATVGYFETVTVMPMIQFYKNSSCLAETTIANVYQIAELIKANPDNRYTLYGYASLEGDKEYNQRLSERRANALRDKLVEAGVNPEQLNVVANGATDRFSTDCRSLNRVVIVEEL